MAYLFGHGGYLLNGSKMFISNDPISKTLYCYSKYDLKMEVRGRRRTSFHF